MEESKYCPLCKSDKPLRSFMSDSKGSFRGVCNACKKRVMAAKLKLSMLEAYGWKCACCGEENPQFLSLDHIENDGAAHRLMFDGDRVAMLTSLKDAGWPKDKYQLLCMNCNTAKGYYGECPHKKGLTAAKVLEEMRASIDFCKELSKKRYQTMAEKAAKIRIEKVLETFSEEDLQSLLEGRYGKG